MCYFFVITAYLNCLSPQQAVAQRVEGARSQLACDLWPQQRLQPLKQLPCCFAGEGDDKQ